MANRVIIVENGEHQYPVTTTENVFDETGVPMSDILNNKAEADHEHNYVKPHEIIPLSTMYNMFDNKAPKLHEHDQYLTADDVNTNAHMVPVPTMDRLVNIETTDDRGETIVESKIITFATLSSTDEHQELSIMSACTIELPIVNYDEFKIINLYVRFNNLDPDVILSLPNIANIRYNRDMSDFKFNNENLYILRFVNVNGIWLTTIDEFAA